MPDRNTSVYNRLQLQFVAAYGMMIRTLVSPQCEAELDTNERLRTLAIPLVCIDAFVRTCRSLDLVLTATGFGIVSTESTAPASKARVDALVEEMSLQELDLIDEMIQELMKVEGWGTDRTGADARADSLLSSQPDASYHTEDDYGKLAQGCRPCFNCQCHPS